MPSRKMLPTIAEKKTSNNGWLNLKIIMITYITLMKLFPIIVTLALAVTFSNCVTESEYIDYASLDSLIKKTANTYINDNDIKGISIGFIDVGNYRREKGFGNVDSSTLFPMASVTKMVTATAILQLVQDGSLDLDGKLSDYLPEFALKNPYPGSSEITIRHLLTHSSGLSRDIMHLAQGFCPPERSEILDYINNHRQISPAGYRHLYSNAGFELLALAIENVSGLPFRIYIKENILEPLMMKKSFFGNQADEVDLTGAYTMSSDDEYVEMPINYIAAGGLKSNVQEMLHFSEMLLRNSLNLPEDTNLKTMFSRQNNDVLLDSDIVMGVSVFLEDMPPPYTGKLVYHGGGAIFTNNMLMLAPDYGLGVIVLCNTAGSYQMVEQLARSAIFEALKIKTGQKPSVRQHHIPEKHPWPVSEQQKIIGEYVTPNNIIRIKADGDSIFARIGENRFPVDFFKDGYFSYYDNFYLKVDEIEEEEILFALFNGLHTPIGKKENLASLTIPESWKHAKGIYISVSQCPEGMMNFYESLRIYVQDNNLYLGMLPEQIVRETYGIATEMSAILKPIDDTTALMHSFGRYGAEPVYINLKDKEIVFSGLTFYKTPTESE